MNRATSLIANLNVTDETDRLEAKQIADKKLGKSFFETVCAFSNEPGLEGGCIILGVVSEEALFPFYAVSGIDDPDKLSADIATGCQAVFNVPVRPKITAEEVDGRCVLIVDVPEVSSHNKPVYIKSKGLPGGAYRRIGSADIRCTDEDLFALFSHRSDDPPDAHVVSEADWDDIDADAIASYRSSRRNAHPSAEELNWSDEDLVFALRGAKKENGFLKPTLSGLLLFGRAQALRRLTPTHRVDYIRVPGRNWVSDPDKRFESIELRGPMVTLVPRVISAILDDLPKSFSFSEGGTAQREETAAVPETVIREAVVNALMHRSYAMNQPVQIIRYANRLEIRNSGYSLKSEEQFDEPGSHIRNPSIAEVLHETRFAENKGSGIRVMRAKMVEAGLTPPTFKSDRNADTFTTFLLFHHFLNEDDLNWLSVFKEYSLNDEQLRALIFVREVGAIDNKSFRDLAKLDTLKASKNLRALRGDGLLVGNGSGNQVYYSASEELTRLITLGPSSQGSTRNSQGNELAPKRHQPISFDELPVAIRKKLTQLKLKRRRNKQDVEAFIVALCSWSPLASKEIADLLENNPTYVQQHFLSGMIDKGLIYYTYPEMVNHPDQKYSANTP